MGPKKKFLAFKRKTSNKAEDQFIKVDGYLLSKGSRFFAWKDENNGYWCLLDYNSGLVIKRGFKTLKDVSDIDQKQAEKDLKQKYKLYASFKQIGNPIEFEKIEKTILKEMEE